MFEQQKMGWLGLGIMSCALPAQGAILRLENAANGSSEVTLAPGESATLNLILEIQPMDTIPGAYLEFELDASSTCIDADGSATGINPWEGMSQVLWPCEIGEESTECDWSYSVFHGGVPVGTWIVDEITIIHSGASITEDVEITFELGASKPMLFGPWPTFYPFVNAPPGLPPLPNFLYIGDSISNNTPFIVHKVTDSSEAVDGDANGDEVVDPLDVGYVLARLGCLVGIGNPDCDAADVNGDRYVDPLDAGYVQARFGK